jgi:membrane fusion protein (multidrug efflux system)
MSPLPFTLFLLACGTEPVAAPTAAAAVAGAPAVRTAAAEAVQYSPRVELTGSLAPAANAFLGFDVPGRIEALLVQRGETVRKGQAVARLDARMAEAQAQQAEAALAGATAQLAAGEAALARLQKLKDAGGVSEQQFQDAEAAVQAGRAGIQQAEAAVRLARTHVANHTLRAPIDGILTNAPDNAGAMVGAGTPLFVIEDVSSLLMKATAPESAAWLTAGLAAEIVVAGGGNVPASVLRVLPTLDPQTRRIPVEVRVDAPPASLRANAFARAIVRGAADISAWKVPGGAVVARPDYCVYVDEAGAPRRVTVEVLERLADGVVVRADLSAGANVIVDPPKELEG